ncbi:MAG: hypothetical protein ACPG21_06335 [Crocinitomicaceae bacterium]
MRLVLPAFLLLIFITACSGDETHSTETTTIEADSTTSSVDSIVVDTILEVEERVFEYFEDYMAITRKSELDSLFGDQLEHKTVCYNEGTEERQISKLTNTEAVHIVTYVW